MADPCTPGKMAAASAAHTHTHTHLHTHTPTHNVRNHQQLSVIPSSCRCIKYASRMLVSSPGRESEVSAQEAECIIRTSPAARHANVKPDVSERWRICSDRHGDSNLKNYTPFSFSLSPSLIYIYSRSTLILSLSLALSLALSPERLVFLCSCSSQALGLFFGLTVFFLAFRNYCRQINSVKEVCFINAPTLNPSHLAVGTRLKDG